MNDCDKNSTTIHECIKPALICSLTMTLPSIYFVALDASNNSDGLWSSVMEILIGLVVVLVTFFPITMSLLIVCLFLSFLFNRSLKDRIVFKFCIYKSCVTFTVLDIILTSVILGVVQLLAVTLFKRLDSSVIDIYYKLLFGYLFSDY